MSIIYTCPWCGSSRQKTDGSSGRQFICLKCGVKWKFVD